jgi:serine/threonine protein phosphatase PrpC
LSRDHKPHDPFEENRIKNAGGDIAGGRVNGCLNLTRAFGDLEYKENKNLSLEEQMITSCP